MRAPGSRLALFVAALLVLVACGEGDGPDTTGFGDPPVGDASNGGDSVGGDPGPGDAPSAGDAGNGDGDCPLGAWCNPIPIDSFPYTDARDTTYAPAADVASYACAPSTDESGGEWVYRVTLAELSLLRVAVDDVSGDGVDVDVHLLTSADPADCVARDNVALGEILDAGVYFIAVDTWVSSSGQPYPGPYTLTVERLPLASGACALEARDVEMVWSSCDVSLDCYEATDPGSGQLERYLRTPSAGPVVMEAHLVTDQDGFGSAWPTSSSDGLANHYALSEATTGYVTARNQDWAPAGEGGSQWGQGSTGAKLPVLAEAWYVNMYWANRPAAGTRMLVIHPLTGDVVVAAGGYETGPGSNTAIGGAVEEIHRWLGTSHRDDLIFGFAVDQTLPLGPYDCAIGSAITP